MVESVILSHLQDILELGGIGSEQCYVQHALGDRLLGGITIGVKGLALEKREGSLLKTRGIEV